MSAWLGVGSGIFLILEWYWKQYASGLYASGDSMWWWNGLWKFADGDAFLFVMLIYMGLYFVFMSQLLFPQLQQVSLNITTNEYLNRSRFWYVRLPGTTPWTGSSIWTNWYEFIFQPNKIDWLSKYDVDATI